MLGVPYFLILFYKKMQAFFYTIQNVQSSGRILKPNKKFTVKNCSLGLGSKRSP